MNVENLINRVYEKYRIQVDPNDPVFQIFFLLLEQNLIIEQEKHAVIQKQVDDVVSGASQKMTMYNDATISTSRQIMSEFLEGISKIFEKKTKSTPKKKETDSSKYIRIWLFVIAGISLVNTVVLILLLFTA